MEELKNKNSDARKRIYSIFDDGSFIETMSYYAMSVITGYGQVDGRLVYVFSEDKMTHDVFHAEKIVRLIEAAGKVGAPIVGIYDSKGVDLDGNLSTLDGVSSILDALSNLKGKVPELSIVVGESVGIASFAPSISDFTFLVKGGHISLFAPNVIGSGEGKFVNADNIGDNRNIHFVEENENKCFNDVKKLLSYFPENYAEYSELKDANDDLNRKLDDYKNVDELVKSLSDNGDFMEVSKDSAKQLKTYLIHIGGMSVGIVANDKLVDEGKLDVDSMKKALKFVKLMDSFNIPILTLVDTKGFKVSLQEEKEGISYFASRLAMSYSTATVPKVTCIIGDAIGGAYAILGSKSLKVDMVYALKDSNISIVSKEAAEKIYEKDAKIDLSVKTSLKEGLVDNIVEKSDLRQVLISTFDSFMTKNYDRGL